MAAESQLSQINEDYIERNRDRIMMVILVQVEEAEMDEMWSFVHDKSKSEKKR